MERNQFTFYVSFLNAIDRIKDPLQRCFAYDSIARYALRGEMPDLDGLPDSVAIVFELIKPTLDSGRKKAESGSNGGKSKQNNSGTKKRAKQTSSDGSAYNRRTSKNENACTSGESKKYVASESFSSKTEFAFPNCSSEKDVEIEIDVDSDNDIEKDIFSMGKAQTQKTQKSNFVRPTIEQVRSYCDERNNGIDPEHFVDYYNANGWMVGKQKMKDWKATVRNWERNNKKNQNQQTGNYRYNFRHPRDDSIPNYDEDGEDFISELRRYEQEQSGNVSETGFPE